MSRVAMGEGSTATGCAAKVGRREAETAIARPNVEETHGAVATSCETTKPRTLLGVRQLAAQERLVSPRMADEGPPWKESQLFSSSSPKRKRVPIQWTSKASGANYARLSAQIALIILSAR